MILTEEDVKRSEKTTLAVLRPMATAADLIMSGKFRNKMVGKESRTPQTLQNWLLNFLTGHLSNYMPTHVQTVMQSNENKFTLEMRRLNKILAADEEQLPQKRHQLEVWLMEIQP